MSKSTQDARVIHVNFAPSPEPHGNCGIGWCGFREHGAPDEDGLYLHMSGYRHVEGIGRFALIARTREAQPDEPRNLAVMTDRGERSVNDALATMYAYKSAIEGLLGMALARYLPPDERVRSSN